MCLGTSVSAGEAAKITVKIANPALRGCSLIFKDDGSDCCVEMYQARTKKVILVSDAIATSSGIVQASIMKNPKRLDLGGAAAPVHRPFSDARFIAELREECMQSGLDRVYGERAKGLLWAPGVFVLASPA